MSGKYSFTLTSTDPRRDLPRKLIIGQHDTETIGHVMLKLFGYVLFFRDRVQLEPNLHTDSIPYVPDVVQLDYELRPKLWVECGECNVDKLDRLAVKVPEAEIWVVKSSLATAVDLSRAMAKHDLRRNRYNLLGLEVEMFDEVCALARSRNALFWVKGEFEPPNMQFDFNGLWFDAPFHILRF